MLDDRAITSLAWIVGVENVLSDPNSLDCYTGDSLSPSRAFGAAEAFERMADVVVRPGRTAEVSDVVRWANEHRVPVIPYGGGTGVMGAVVPARGGVVLDMKRMNSVHEIDAASLTARVDAGVVLGDLESILAEQGLMIGHDPYSVPIATVAGTISTNGVGYRACAHGPMGEQVVGLEAVLPDGRVIETRDVPKYSSGPNLNHLFIGAEGVFGVITRATIRVYRIPECSQFASVGFDCFEDGFNAASEMLALGIRPSLLDLTEEDGDVTLHLLFEGFTEGVAAQAQRSEAICDAAGGYSLGTEPTEHYWAVRRDSAENYKLTALGQPRQVRWNRWRRRRGFDYLHLALPASRVLEYRRQAGEILESQGIAVAEYAIWSRPEMFSMLILPESGDPAEARQRLALTVDRVLRLAQDMGGVMEYCHGVGVKLNHLLARELGVGHDVIRQMKQTFDPNNIMNPGKLGM
jgi:alkyldihydroxyacetonephosphate synthase